MPTDLSLAVAEYRAAHEKLLDCLDAESTVPDRVRSDLTHFARQLLSPRQFHDDVSVSQTVLELHEANMRFLSARSVSKDKDDESGIYSVSDKDFRTLHGLAWNLLSQMASLNTQTGHERYGDYVRALVAVGQFDRACETAAKRKDKELLIWLIEFMKEEVSLRRKGKPRSQGFSISGIQAYIEYSERNLTDL